MRTESTSEILETFDIHRKTLGLWIKKGCPCDKGGPGKGDKFDSGEVASWMRANGLTGAVGRPIGPIGEELAAAKLRKEIAMANLHEFKVESQKKMMVSRADQDTANAVKYRVISDRLLLIAPAMATKLAGLDCPEIERLLDAEVRTALSEIARV